MGTALTSVGAGTPKATYKDLLHLDNGNTGVAADLQRLSDGEGNDLPIWMSSDAVRVSRLDIVKATPYNFILMTRSDQPTYPPVQVDIDSGSFVISPETGGEWTSKEIALEAAKIDSGGNQAFSWSMQEGYFKTEATMLRIMDSSAAVYRELAIKSLTLSDASSENIYSANGYLVIRSSAHSSKPCPTVVGELSVDSQITAGNPALVVTGATSQSGDLQQWKDRSGNVLGRINKDGYTVIKKIAAPADGDLAASECALWFDDTNGAGKLMVKAKTANGTVVTGSVTLT